MNLSYVSAIKSGPNSGQIYIIYDTNFKLCYTFKISERKREKQGERCFLDMALKFYMKLIYII